MSNFPTLHSGAQAIYPLTRQAVYNTEVQQFVGGAETRFVSEVPQYKFTLVFTNIDGVDLSNIQNFFVGTGGATTSTFSFTLFINGANVTFNSLVFDQDDFSPTTGTPGRFNLTLKVRQFINVTS